MYSQLLLTLLGAIGLSVSLFLLYRTYTLTKTGIRTEGIIFDLQREVDSDINLEYPVIRFKIDSGEWITEPHNIGLSPGLYKKGAKVVIQYDSQNPKSFTIVSTFSFLVPALIALISLAVLIMSIFFAE